MSNHILLASYLLLNILISSSPYFSRTNSRAALVKARHPTLLRERNFSLSSLTFTFPTTHTLMPCSLMPVYFSMPACRHCRASLDMAYLFFGGGVDAVVLLRMVVNGYSINRFRIRKTIKWHGLYLILYRHLIQLSAHARFPQAYQA